MRNVTIGGKQFQVGDEPADYWGWVTEGRYDHEWAVYDKHLKPEHTFIDLGAWVGAHSLYASKIAKRVIAVEPDPVAYKILLANLDRLIVEDKAEALELAISNPHQTEVKLGSGLLGASTTRVNPNAGGGIGAWDENQTCNVPCASLLTLIENLSDPLFIKVDIEGSEEEILACQHSIRERKPTMLIELHPFWWKDPKRTWKQFENIKAMYAHVEQPIHNTWVLSA